MISELVDPSVLQRALAQFRANLVVELRQLRAGDAGAKARADATGASESDIRDARDRLDDWKTREAQDLATGNTPIAIPRSPVVALVQSAYEEFFVDNDLTTEAPEVAGLSSSQTPAADVVLDAEARAFLLGERDYLAGRWLTRYAERDMRFLTWWAAAKLAALGRRRAFTDTPAPPLRIDDRARVLLVGDWGSGVPRAQQVAAVMRVAVEQAKASGQQCHVIHLGDVYYTGQPSEYDRRFLEFWPVKSSEAGEITSWCLNANHDMYSGGYAYFDHLLKDPRFRRQQQCSFFCLENDHWQIVGLDSGYDEGDLHGPQADWAKQVRVGAPKKKGVLLSHHQPFSAWEDSSPLMMAKLAPILDQHLVAAWFWGHEHRCALYEPRPTIRYPRLAGHGGVPVWASQQATPAGVSYEFRDSFTAYVNEKFARFGYVQLDFADQRIDASYISELGQVHHREVIE